MTEAPARFPRPTSPPLLRLFGVCTGLALLVPAAASAGTVSSDGTTGTFNAAPGEAQLVVVSYETDDDDGSLETTFTDLQNRVDTSTPDQCARSKYLPNDDTIVCEGHLQVVVNAGDRDDTVTGTDGGDQLNGGDGNDVLIGSAGNDTLDGGAGDDGLEGTLTQAAQNPKFRAGADTLIGGPGSDAAAYSGGFNPITASIDNVANDGESGEGDNVTGDVENIRGGYGNDTLIGDSGPNRFLGEPGDDELRGGGGNDQLDGGRHQDRSFGEDGDDEIFSGQGDDLLDGGDGADRMEGDGGENACSTFTDCDGRGADTIKARDNARDVIGCGIHTDTVEADALDELAATCENVDRGADLTSPALTASAPRKLKLRTVLKKGVPVTVTCDEACSVSASATVKGAGKVATGRTSLSGAGNKKLVLKFTKKARKKLASKRAVKLSVRLKAADTAGNSTTTKGTITIRR